MIKRGLFSLLILFFVCFLSNKVSSQTTTGQEFKDWALTPPMGWNSWDCFGPSVVEAEVKANADYMAANLKGHGWEYVVVDIRWYVDNQTSGFYNAYNNSTFILDSYGRYMPSPTRFPSAANGAGFKPLADYIHGLGLKFGIHIMRGVPKEAVFNKMPIKGTGFTADQIYSDQNLCGWLPDNYTVDSTKPGAQEYYDSIFELYASWGLDFVKVDDLSRPYHKDEIEMIRKAIDKSGRPIVFSTSPGKTPLTEADHVKNNANMWRLFDDFWDVWDDLNKAFGICADWAQYTAPGSWPDADMLPMGKFIRGERAINRYTNFTHDEQYTLMTLWSIFKSLLMFGGNLPDNDTFTNSLISNDEVLEMHRKSVNNKEWFNNNEQIGWTADDPDSGDKFVALFNNGGDGFVSTKKLLFQSEVVSVNTIGNGTSIDVQIPLGSNQLYLIVNDGGDGFSADHADWINPTIYLDNGNTVRLTDLTWEFATSGWSSVNINKSVSGGTLTVNGQTYTNGLGTHSKSVILYKIPENTVRFTAFGGLDVGGTSQGIGSTVQFLVSNEDPTTRSVEVNNAVVNTGRISRSVNREGKNIEADITGASKLYLVVTDAGDNFNYDHADWVKPTLVKDNGESLLLTSLNWVSASSGWSTVKKNTSLDGNPLKINGATYANGFGVNAYSIIEFDLPAGYTKFTALCGFDDEVLNAANGVSIEFMVFTENPSIAPPVAIPLDLMALGFDGDCVIRDMWMKKDLGTFKGAEFTPLINKHGAGLYRVSAAGPVSETIVAVADELILDQGTTISNLVGGGPSVLANDTYQGTNTLTAILVGQPNHGQVVLNTNGTFSYIHDGSKTTSDSFSYKVSDGISYSNTVNVDITINLINHNPVAVIETILVNEGTAATTLVGGATSILDNDTDADGDTLNAVLVSSTSHGVLLLNPNGTFNYVYDGSGVLTDSFVYKANDGNLDSNEMTVDIAISLLQLPSNNFSIETVSETCAGKNNGQIIVNALESRNYTATVNGVDKDFISKNLTLTNLNPGNYEVCIHVAGTSFEQCHNVVISGGATLTARAVVGDRKVTVEITEGTSPYEVFVNGESKFETIDSNFYVEVQSGDLLEVKTAKSCEGIYSNKIIGLVANNILGYPNPTTGVFQIAVPGPRMEVDVEVLNAAGQLIIKGTYPVLNGTIKLDIEKEPAGVYLVKVFVDATASISIIKK